MRKLLLTLAFVAFGVVAFSAAPVMANHNNLAAKTAHKHHHKHKHPKAA